jgi:exosome complex component RRP45
VSGELGKPAPERPAEGILQIYVEWSKLSSCTFDEDALVESQSLLQGLLERGIRESDALDLETLCVQVGDRVWHIRCDIRVLSDNGNVLDCAVMALLCALGDYVRPAVTLQGEHEILMHELSDREPVPLVLHRHPVCFSFGVMSESVLVLDPTLSEEMCCSGHLSIWVAGQDVCGIYKSGASVSRDTLLSVISQVA